MRYKKLLDKVERNLFVSEIIKSGVSISYNKKMERLIRDFSSIDSISDSQELQLFLTKLPAQHFNSSYSLKHAYSVNTLYGYAQSLMEYANINHDQILFFPLVEHGIQYSSDIYEEKNFVANRSYIFQGRYLEKSWNEKQVNKKAYFVGPYIHYARQYYKGKTIDEIKAKNGKTLLVFPPHSIENDYISFESNSFNKQLFDVLSKEYETIIACVYWADLSSNYTDFLRQKGVKVVSAGFKLDPLFISRLKTIIELSDVVVYPSFISSIGYAFYQKKKVIVLDNSKDIKSPSSIQVFDNKITKSQLFASYFGIDDEPFSEKQEAIINKYWGISEIKTPLEIRAIFNENKSNIIHNIGF